MRHLYQHAILLLIATLGFFQSVNAQTYTTINSGIWNNASNWDLGDIPNYMVVWPPPDEQVNIVIQHDIDLTDAESVLLSGRWNSIIITNGATLTINLTELTLQADTYITNISVIDGSLILNNPLVLRNGAELNVYADGDVTVNNDILCNGMGGFINIDAGGDMTINGTLTISEGNSSVSNSGNLNLDDLVVSGGNTNFISGGVVHIDNDVSILGSGALNIQAGFMFIDGDFTNNSWLPSFTPSVTIDGYVNVVGNVNNTSIITGIGGIGWQGDWIEAPSSAYSPAFVTGAEDPQHNPYDLGTGGPYTGPLPVELIFFTARMADNKIRIEWATAQEENFDHFILEHSTDGRNFTEIGTINGHGNTNTRHDYSYSDASPSLGLNYYRLQSVDYDGSSESSDLASAKFIPKNQCVSIYPNPGKGDLINLSGLNPTETNGEFWVYDLNGKLINQQLISIETNKITFNNQLKKGAYIALIKLDNSIYKQKLIVE